METKPEVDRLGELFEKQIVLQHRLANFPLTDETRQDFINVQTLALVDEVFESLRETPWKPWKKNKSMNLENYKEELVDAWHFLINLTLAAEMNSQELYERFCNKNKENHKRQDEGY